MSIASYAELQSAVAGWLVRSDLTARIPDFIALTEAKLNRELRTEQTLTRSVGAIGTEFSLLPTDFIEIKTFQLFDGSTTTDLDQTTLEQISASEGWSTAVGRPRYFALVEGQIQLYPSPDQSYTGTMTYFSGVPALSDANPSNWVLANAPDVYLYGSLKEAGPLLRDTDALATYTSLFVEALGSLKLSSRTKVGTLRTEIPQLTRRHSGHRFNAGF